MAQQDKTSLEWRINYEREFFDNRAIEHRDDDLNIKTDYSQALKILGLGVNVLSGKSVLDCGCGLGELTVWLATKGALVSAIDVSPRSLEVLHKRAAFYEVTDHIQTRIMPLENLEYDNDTFDYVVGEWILHHVMLDRAIPEIYRVLKRDGIGVFLETSASNRILMFCRKFIIGHFGIPKYQDAIEHPITNKDIHLIKDTFNNNFSVYYFPYIFLSLFDRYIFRSKFKIISKILSGCDRMIYKYLPFLRKYGYFKIITFRKAFD